MGNENAGTAEIGPILAWSDIKYISPVVYPDTVRVEFDIVKLEEDRLGKSGCTANSKIIRGYF